MSVKLTSGKSPGKTANELLSQRAGLVMSCQRRSELERRIKAYESRYGIKSRSVHAAIDRGDLKETHDVCRWIMDYDLLRRSKAH